MRRLHRVGASLAIAAAGALAAVLLIPAALGYQRYVITSGSMTGTYDRGTLVFAKAVPVDGLRVGDVITYTPPSGAGPAGLVTHRIAAIDRSRPGAPVLRTKGDANPTADPWRFTLRSRTQARVAFGLPYLGFPLAALSIRELRMALVGLPALVIGLLVAADLWREPRPEGTPA